VDVESKDKNGNTALGMAAYCGRTDAVKLLLEHGADVNATAGWGDWTALMKAAYGGHAEAVRLLLEHGADANARESVTERMTVLMKAAEGGHAHSDIIESLIAHGADVNAKDKHGETALITASEHGGRDDVVQSLLEHDADVNAKEYGVIDALEEAAGEGRAGAVKLLLLYGADVNATGALFSASWYGHPEVVKILVSHGADIYATDTNGHTAAAGACQLWSDKSHPCPKTAITNALAQEEDVSAVLERIDTNNDARRARANSEQLPIAAQDDDDDDAVEQYRLATRARARLVEESARRDRAAAEEADEETLGNPFSVGGTRADYGNGKFLGTLNGNRYDPNSVSNPYGQYGSRYAPDSVNNPYGRYGSPYSPDGSANPYTTGGAKVVDPESGKFLGTLNSNRYDPNSVSNPYGIYGSKYSPDSVNNPYGKYGSPYSVTPAVIVAPDSDGE